METLDFAMISMIFLVPLRLIKISDTSPDPHPFAKPRGEGIMLARGEARSREVIAAQCDLWKAGRIRSLEGIGQKWDMRYVRIWLTEVDR